MVNIRYTLSQKDFDKQQKDIKDRIKEEFKKVAKEENIDLMKLNIIRIGAETFYNPYKYKSHNRWIRKFQE